MKRLLLAALCALSFPAVAEVAVSDAWARATPPGARTAAVYLTLENDGEADALIGAETEASDFAELHTHVHADGMMRMEQVKRIPVPAEGQTELKPHGDHLMLVSLRRPLVAGERLTLSLVFERQPPLTLEVPIRDMRR